MRGIQDSPLFLLNYLDQNAMVAQKYADMLAIAATASSGVFTGVLRL